MFLAFLEILIIANSTVFYSIFDVAGLSMFGQETPPVAAKSVAPTYFRNVAGRTLVNDYDLGQAPVNFPLQNFETGMGETKFEPSSLAAR